MSSTIDDFKSVLAEESEREVDLAKLAGMAQHFIPAEIRGKVWMYLLGAARFDNSNKAQEAKDLVAEYEAISKINMSLQTKLSRVLQRVAKHNTTLADVDKSKRIENVLLAYSNYNHDFQFSNGHIFMLLQFASCLNNETEMFFCFVKLMQMIEPLYGSSGLDRSTAKLMSVFRTLLPELYAHLEDEEVSPNSWAVPWLQQLFASQLPVKTVSRLWDVYFSCDEGLALHVYVCVALLADARETLGELDGEALIQSLSKLRTTDVNRLVAQAYNIKNEMDNSEL